MHACTKTHKHTETGIGSLVTSVFSKHIRLLEDEKADIPNETKDWNAAKGLPWILKAHQLNPEASSCGLVGTTLLHAVLDEVTKAGRKVEAKQIVCEAPTYYSMMAATFLSK